MKDENGGQKAPPVITSGPTAHPPAPTAAAVPPFAPAGAAPQGQTTVTPRQAPAPVVPPTAAPQGQTTVTSRQALAPVVPPTAAPAVILTSALLGMPISGETPVAMVDTVGKWRDKSRRRIEALKIFAGMLAAGLTLFAAVKISDAGSTTGYTRLLVALFQTTVVISAFAWFRCYGKAQLDFDLLNRYLPTTEGGTWVGTTGPLNSQMTIGQAEPIVRAAEPKLKKPWPAKGDGAFFLMAGTGLFAAVLLVLYLWWPVFVPPHKPPAPPVPSSIGVVSSVHFDKNRAQVPPDAARRLEELARLVAPRSTECFRVEGHADSDGPSDYNLDLSSRRTHAVSEVLAGNGVAQPRIEMVPYGVMRPSDSARSESAKAENRRVDVVVVRCK